MFPVFVDHIPSSADTSDLRKLFSSCGTVLDISIISSYGFVNFEVASDALQAIERFNGYRLQGSRLSVDPSKELEDYVRSSRRRDRGNQRFLSSLSVNMVDSKLIFNELWIHCQINKS